MGRPPRIQESSLHFHIIVRCNNEAFHFQEEEDFQLYLDLLGWVKKRHGFHLYNYELMNSHVHLLLKPSFSKPLAETMLLINWKYALQYNQRKKRKGHFWMQRYTSMPVETDRYALTLMRYINRNPIRAGMVEKPGDWQWSGYHFYAFGEPNPLLEPHPSFLMLGSNDAFREKSYRDFVEQLLPSEDHREPQFSEGDFIGSEVFGEKIARRLCG